MLDEKSEMLQDVVDGALEFREQIATNVRRLRDDAGYTQQALANRAGIDRTYLARLETQSINISVDVLYRLSQALEVSVVSLVIADPRSLQKELKSQG